MASTDSSSVFADQATAGLAAGQGGEAGQATRGAALGGAGDDASAGAPAGCAPVYLVPEHVRVRREDFGLLFYDTRSTRLTFVRSGDRLVPPPFTGAGRALLPAGPAGPDAALRRLLDGLVGKGLLVAASDE